MAQVLRQSTAATIAIGPFLDSGDGNTVESGLTLTQPDIRLSKNGGAFAQKSAAQTLSHMENGYYSLSLSTTDTNTVGRLTVHVHESGALPVFHEFQVVEEAVYDALFVASATGALPVASGGIASTAFASGAITAAAIATDAIGAAELAADAVTEIAAGVLDVVKDQDRRGTAQGAGSGSNTLVLAAGDQEADDFYNGAIVVLLEGAGTVGYPAAERVRRVTDYVNSSNQITVDANWPDTVDDTTVYLIVGG